MHGSADRRAAGTRAASVLYYTGILRGTRQARETLPDRGGASMSNPNEVFVDLPGGRRLRALAGGQGETVFLLVHGADRNFQNAGHWQAHLAALGARGRFLAVDLLGHGGSQPGPSAPLDSPVTPAEQVQALLALLDQQAPKAPIVIVGRSYGGRIALELATARPGRVQALILIAPSVAPAELAALSPAVRAKPVLLVWAQDDPVVPFPNHAGWREAFASLRMANAGSINPPPDQRWRAHMPENERPAQIQRAVAEFLNGLS